jgi:FKBP-type peptidyl-prolyl cis-trans isomerase
MDAKEKQGEKRDEMAETETATMDEYQKMLAKPNAPPLTSDGGVKKEVVRAAPEGSKCPPDGALVQVHYEGRLFETGAMFDSSRARNQPFEFKLGVGQVVDGWDIGVKAMRKGELAQLYCRSDYGYGWEGKPPRIPQDAELLFEIELLSWRVSECELCDISVEMRLAEGLAQRAEGTALLKEGSHEVAAELFQTAIRQLTALPRAEGEARRSGGAGGSALATPEGLLSRVHAEARVPLLSCLLNASQVRVTTV